MLSLYLFVMILSREALTTTQFRGLKLFFDVGALIDSHVRVRSNIDATNYDLQVQKNS